MVLNRWSQTSDAQVCFGLRFLFLLLQNAIKKAFYSLFLYKVLKASQFLHVCLSRARVGSPILVGRSQRWQSDGSSGGVSYHTPRSSHSIWLVVVPMVVPKLSFLLLVALIFIKWSFYDCMYSLYPFSLSSFAQNLELLNWFQPMKSVTSNICIAFRCFYIPNCTVSSSRFTSSETSRKGETRITHIERQFDTVPREERNKKAFHAAISTFWSHSTWFI